MYLLLFFYFYFCTLSFGQNKHFTIGYKDYGLSFGNSINNNGIRINLFDRNVDKVNGLNISGISKSKISNGLNFGIIWNENTICNGIILNGLLGESMTANGIILSGLGYGASKINGIGIGGLALVGDTLNGLFLSPIGISYWNDEVIKVINGLTIGLIIGASTEKLNGVSVSLFNNWIGEQNGVTIGLINRAKKITWFSIWIMECCK